MSYIKNSHRNVKAVGDQFYRYKSFKDPLEENPCFKAGEIIVINNHLDQFPAGNEGKYQTCYRNNHRF